MQTEQKILKSVDYDALFVSAVWTSLQNLIQINICKARHTKQLLKETQLIAERAIVD